MVVIEDKGTQEEKSSQQKSSEGHTAIFEKAQRASEEAQRFSLEAQEVRLSGSHDSYMNIKTERSQFDDVQANDED